MYTLNRLAEDGHCYALRQQLTETGAKLLEVEEELLSPVLDRMIADRDVITAPVPESEDVAIYLPPFFYAEVGVQNRMRGIAAGEATVPRPAQVSMREDIEYDEIQLEAIRTALKSKIMVLTGGPGTGKSTTTLGIIRAFGGMRILLAAPTGRAAKRLSEVTGREAKTIHRLLEFKPPEGYKRNEDNPLEGDVLIVDECSMVDEMLMYSLLRAVPDSMRVILVGDVDQLPSVGAGNVLRDIIDSGAVPVVRLTKIFRQAAAGRIILNAHRINGGEFPDLSNGAGTDFFFQKSEEPEKAAEIIVDLVKNRLPKFYHVPPQAIQVLTPMQRGVVGAANLNQLLQAAVNPPVKDFKGNPGPELHRGGYTFRAGDKVMQIKNNYDKEVFNGDIGTIEKIDPEDRTLTVRFDDRGIEYDATELDEMVLAYATTVHKAQGAEYPIVVMPVMMSHFMMLQRNLLYTGVTRAKKTLVLVGQKKAVGYCVRNVTVDKRNTLLAERLKGMV
jgi:exodeoxyribonuclease V alpha subunit